MVYKYLAIAIEFVKVISCLVVVAYKYSESVSQIWLRDI